MNRIVQLAASAALLAGTGTAAMAQEMTNTAPFFQPPVFALLPSALTTNVISAPEGVDSHTAFNARFQAVVPTSSPWLSFVGGAQWGFGNEDHGPIIFLGGILPIAPLTTVTGGWFGLSLNPLWVVTPGLEGGGVENDFVGEAAVVLNLGAKMMPTGGFWSGLAAFFLLDQNLTPEEDLAGDKDYWNPVLIYGLSIPIAPMPGS